MTDNKIGGGIGAIMGFIVSIFTANFIGAVLQTIVLSIIGTATGLIVTEIVKYIKAKINKTKQ